MDLQNIYKPQPKDFIYREKNKISKIKVYMFENCCWSSNRVILFHLTVYFLVHTLLVFQKISYHTTGTMYSDTYNISWPIYRIIEENVCFLVFPLNNAKVGCGENFVFLGVFNNSVSRSKDVEMICYPLADLGHSSLPTNIVVYSSPKWKIAYNMFNCFLFKVFLIIFRPLLSFLSLRFTKSLLVSVFFTKSLV